MFLLLGERSGPTRVPPRHRGYVGALHNLHRLEELPGDVAVTYHAKPNVIHLAHSTLPGPGALRGYMPLPRSDYR